MSQIKEYKVSLIVPLYNAEAFIENTLKMLLSQTYDSIEFVIVNDCSLDNSINVINQFLLNHPRKADVSIYNRDINGGASAARNSGILHSRGEYILFVDADDEITIDCVALHVSAIENVVADFSVAGMKTIGGSTIHNKLDVQGVYENDDILNVFLLRKWVHSPCNKLIKRELIINNKIFFKEGIIYEDILWCYYLAFFAEKMVAINQETYFYYIRPGSVTTAQKGIRQINSYVSVIDEIVNNRPPNNKFFASFMNFQRLNASLTLLQTKGCRWSEKKDFYNQINSEKNKNKCEGGIYYHLLNLPFFLFQTLMSIPYFLYKLKK